MSRLARVTRPPSWGRVTRILATAAFVAFALHRAPDPYGVLLPAAITAVAAVGVGLLLGHVEQPLLCQGDSSPSAPTPTGGPPRPGRSGWAWRPGSAC